MNPIAEYIRDTVFCTENKSVVVTDYALLDKYLISCGSFIALRNICAKFGRSVSSEWGLSPAELKKKPVVKAKPRLPKPDKKLARVIKAKAKVAKKVKAVAKKAKPSTKKTRKQRS